MQVKKPRNAAQASSMPGGALRKSVWQVSTQGAELQATNKRSQVGVSFLGGGPKLVVFFVVSFLKSHERRGFPKRHTHNLANIFQNDAHPMESSKQYHAHGIHFTSTSPPSHSFADPFAFRMKSRVRPPPPLAGDQGLAPTEAARNCLNLVSLMLIGFGVYMYVCYVIAWYVISCFGMVCDVLLWYGMVWYGMVWYGMVWYGMVWYGMVWYGMVWYGMVWYVCMCKCIYAHL